MTGEEITKELVDMLGPLLGIGAESKEEFDRAMGTSLRTGTPIRQCV